MSAQCAVVGKETQDYSTKGAVAPSLSLSASPAGPMAALTQPTAAAVRLANALSPSALPQQSSTESVPEEAAREMPPPVHDALQAAGLRQLLNCFKEPAQGADTTRIECAFSNRVGHYGAHSSDSRAPDADAGTIAASATALPRDT